ncbi:phosphatidylinositol 3,4,5-trisphosphate 5-phosphatase 2-like [Dysidea avara]|uniref:phosphatidylinositol 3,4,5-trisphosphate 5-phosphatase 2-like n=1 Tax=Dysidea avara TaxID=196820 RepID=UPI00332FE3CD
MSSYGEDLSGRPWYHQSLSRMDGEKLLVESNRDGAFLVRSSDTVKGAYVLSIISQNRIHHYRIIPCGDGMLKIESQAGVQARRFGSLPELIDYYVEPRRGLASPLTFPVQQPQEEPEEESDDEEDEAEMEQVTPATAAINGSNAVETRDGSSILSKIFTAALKNQDKSCVSTEFHEAVKQYISVGGLANDMGAVCSSQPSINNLTKLVSEDCHRLHKELDNLLTKLDVLKMLFETASGVSFRSSTLQRKSTTEESLYEALPEKLMKCRTAVQGLEDTAFTALKELHTRVDGLPVSPSPATTDLDTVITPKPTSGSRSCDGVVVFQVYLTSALQGRRNQMNFKVNIREGKLTVGKAGEPGTMYDHNQIHQLVKSRSKEQRLGIVLEGQGRKDYMFESLQAREQFCQLIQLVRNKHNENTAVNSLSLFIGTWNMGDAPPPLRMDSWLMCEGLGKPLDSKATKVHDIYAIGSQECSKVKEIEWLTKIKTVLKQLTKLDYEKVAMNTLWGMRILILAKPEHMNSISHVQMSQVRTGIGNTLGNKGAVGVSFYFGSTSFCFINSHLTSGNEKCHRRNNNFHDILKGLVGLKQKKQLSIFDLTLQFHHLFWFGDLNYRVDLAATDIVELAKTKDYFAICLEDQLRKEKDKGKVFVGFDETPILFPPTYRYKTNINHRTTDDYVWLKQKRSGVRVNVPSFCDRVLWRSYPGTYIVNLAYGCSNDVYTSDHSPLFSVFSIEKVGQYTANVDQPLGNDDHKKASIVIKSCKAEIITNSKATFYMELHSQCFEGQHRSSPNKDFLGSTSSGKVGPVWNSSDKPLLEIHPIIADPDYLELQHILVSLKSKESDESYAECCVSLRNLIGDTPETVVRQLTHSALAVGEIEILMHVTVEGYKKKALSRQTTNYYQMDTGFIQTDNDTDDTLEKRQRVLSNASSQDRRQFTSSMVVREKEPHEAIRELRSQSNVIPSRPPIAQRRPRLSNPEEDIPPALPLRNRQISENPTSPTNGHATTSSLVVSHDTWKSLDDRPALPPKQRKSYYQPSSGSPPIPKRLSATPPAIPRHGNVHSSNCNTLPASRPKVPVKPTFTATPKTVTELLQMHNATKHLQLLIDSGYDDINYICETGDDELFDIGIVDKADREQLLRVFEEYASKNST